MEVSLSRTSHQPQTALRPEWKISTGAGSENLNREYSPLDLRRWDGRIGLNCRLQRSETPRDETLRCGPVDSYICRFDPHPYFGCPTSSHSARLLQPAILSILVPAAARCVPCPDNPAVSKAYDDLTAFLGLHPCLCIAACMSIRSKLW